MNKAPSFTQFNKKSLMSLVIFIVALILISVSALVYIKSSESPDITSDISLSNESNINEDDGMLLSNGKCEGTDKPQLTNLPMDESDFSFIIPYGMTVGAHVTPIDHQYFSPTDYNSARDAYPVYAMADAIITDIGSRITDRGEEYRLVFSMSCKLFYYYDLVTKLTPEIEEQRRSEAQGAVISVKAGQQIGWIGGQTLDFAVWDMDIELSGYVIPEHYEGESWKIHTADPLLYYTDGLKAKVLAKYIRTSEPISGKIDYDIDGKLVGNWFLEGTNWYEGGSRDEYWKGHLSISPDHLDPASYVFSIGDYANKATQFAIRGNKPDPAIVNVNTGLVKYELVQQDWADLAGNHWNRMDFVKGLKAMNHENQVEGVVLVQMLEDRKIKVEAFPGKTATQVNAFTANSKVYTR